MIPVSVWFSGTLAVATGISAVVLSIQRGLQHKGIRLEEDSHLKKDFKRDLHTPYADNNRLTRITFGTLLLTAIAAFNLYDNIKQTQQTQTYNNSVWHIASSVFIFIPWLYATVLAFISRQYPLPDKWGWRLNVHLCIFYTLAWIVSVFDFCQTVLIDHPNLKWLKSLPFILRVLVGFDLMYVTATTKQGPPYLDETGRQVCHINVESICGILFMNWCTDIVHSVAEKKGDMVDEDLPALTPGFRAYNIFYIFGASRGKNLIMRILTSNRGAMIVQVGLSVLASCMHYAPAFFMNRLLQFLQDYNNGVHFEHPVQYGIMIVVGMGLCIVINGVIVGQQWYYATCLLQSRVRTMLNVEIYRKSLRRRDLSVANDDENQDNASSSSGAIVNLMGTDSSRIADFSSIWFSIIAAPVELTVGIYFLYQLMGMSSIYGLLFMLLILPVNHFNSKLFSKTQDRLMVARDKRVSLMNEVLQGIRQIKFFAWEKRWEKRIMDARKQELHHLAVTYINGVFFSLVWQGIYAELRYALNVIPETFIQGIAAYSSIKRIQKFLQEDEIDPVPTSNHLDTVDISFKNATIGWKRPESDDDDSFTMKNVNASFPNGELSLISGSTGAGKTLMLLGLLGEAVLLDGQVKCPRVPISDTIESEINQVSLDSKDWILEHSVAYVSQTPWLQNASIRNNILFGLPYIDARYKQTLYACALDKDLSIFEDGDRTEIGEKGITLSGGQKARVALARAVYSRAQNVLMDDVLSAVDAHTAKHLYEECLMGPLMKNRTRILVTHHVRLCLKGCGLLVHVDNGHATHVGSPSELRQSGKLALIVEEDNQVDEEDANEEAAIEETKPVAETNSDEEQKDARVLIEEESRASGSVKLRLYGIYFKMVGNTAFWIVMIAIVLGARGLEIGESWWIKNWAQSYDRFPNENSTMLPLGAPQIMSRTYSYATVMPSMDNQDLFIESQNPVHTTPSEGSIHINYYLGIYSLIAFCNVIFGSLRYGYLYWGAIRANKTLYADLLHRVFRAPLRFFDTTPMGRILNRFSKDFESVDARIPTDLMIFAIQWLAIISSAITVCCVLPIFILPMIIIVIINFLIGIDYTSSSRELKRLDSVTRSPVFSNFTETISGVATIRAYGVSQQFLRVMMESIDANVRPFFYSWSVNRWVSIRYSVTSATINFVACAFTLWNSGKLDVALAGFGLSFVLMFTDNMFWGIRQYTGLEMSMNAIERIVEFMEMDQEAPDVTELRAPAGWPTKGAIEVKDLEARYAADLDPVIRGISFSVKPKEKIGVVGRTGSGKSTLALAFFRFIEATAGSIVIDGINIEDLGTEDLRSNLTIIPQDPTLFSGTLRSNMDPFDQFDDESVFAAFRRVHLIREDNGTVIAENGEEVNSNVFKDLNTAVSEGGKNFSQGQRQLLCLARALLKRSRIVLMDEATASVDFETDKAIQKTIATEFADSTILCIAHRLHTVIEYDRILVLDHGKILEFENPLTLISNPESSFYKMCRNSGEFDTLLELAQKTHGLVDAN